MRTLLVLAMLVSTSALARNLCDCPHQLGCTTCAQGKGSGVCDLIKEVGSPCRHGDLCHSYGVCDGIHAECPGRLGELPEGTVCASVSEGCQCTGCTPEMIAEPCRHPECFLEDAVCEGTPRECRVLPKPGACGNPDTTTTTTTLPGSRSVTTTTLPSPDAACVEDQVPPRITTLQARVDKLADQADRRTGHAQRKLLRAAGRAYHRLRVLVSRAEHQGTISTPCARSLLGS